MNTDPNPLQKPGLLTWLGTAAVAATAVGFGVVNHKEIGETITRLRSVEPVAGVEQPAVVAAPATDVPAQVAAVDGPEAGGEDVAAPVADPASRMVFDLVRVESDGTTLVAGRADPGKRISVVVDGTAQGEVLVDASGSFVAFLDLAESDQPRVMWLMAEMDDGAMVMSESSVILAPHASPSAVSGTLAGLDSLPQSGDAGPVAGVAGDHSLAGPLAGAPGEVAVQGQSVALGAPPEALPVGAAPEPTSAAAEVEIAALPTAQELPDRAAQPVVQARPEPASVPVEDTAAGTTAEPAPVSEIVAAVEAPEIPAAQARDTAPVPAALATPSAQPPRVLVSDLDGVRVFDAPQLADPGDLRLDTISYGAQGDVLLRGRTGPGGAIRFLLSGQAAGRAVAGENGLWLAKLNDVPAGDYTLRLERLDDGGAVLNVVSLPFRRESPERLASALGPRDIQVVTVQPGATLWAIARERYGDGAQYVQVFEANKSQISDPDLIYPGQVFGLPQAQPSAQ